MMKKILCALLVSTLAATACAADTYGYLAFWQNPNDGSDSIQVKTTKENASQIEAATELESFCKGEDALAGVAGGKGTGCQSVMALNNTCVALAYPKAAGKLSPDNAVVITSPYFKKVHQIALNQCVKKYGSAGQCALEIVYCTDSSYYGGTVKTIWNRLKSK
ncbi:DUF4189 domain-containing protein [Neisseria perflava]|uniref:DUF4189 domain-containing protein n=1 Tax=Neisseria perflava TaxID=33053 RepID=UPI00209D2457|nr:DUF4189 domain-containing protein [Neisseria perflava]